LRRTSFGRALTLQDGLRHEALQITDGFPFAVQTAVMRRSPAARISCVWISPVWISPVWISPVWISPVWISLADHHPSPVRRHISTRRISPPHG
jgi:hypothetical protein